MRVSYSNSTILLATVSAYVIPKILTQLCMRTDVVAQGKLAKLRNTMAAFQEKVRNKLSRENWVLITGILADNAWFGTCGYLLLLRMRGNFNFNEFDHYAKVAEGFLVLCGTAYLTRFFMAEFFPKTAPYIATRSEENI
jgi:hypothetical protein